tara:strand:+ start:1946 stop:2614 length:669 start_codon:yes stop_codon:yes gene_type:complete
MANYLTPDWLMRDINQLLARTRKGLRKYGGDDNVLSKDEFEDEYFHSSVGDYHYYDYDFADEYSDRISDFGPYSFGRKQGAYDAYLKTIGGPGHVSANIFDPASLVTGMETATGVKEGAYGSSDAFTAFTPEMFKKLRTEYYQPEIERGRENLLDDLIAKNRLATARGGGFSGYGGRERSREAVKDQYQTGVEGMYADVEQARAGALQDIYDVLGQYETLRG